MRQFMRVAALLALAGVYAGCQSGGEAVHVGPDPRPGEGFRFVGEIEGKIKGQTFLYAAPTSALVKASGNMKVTARAFPPPFLVIDGDGDVIVEPLPGLEEEAMSAVRKGEILIRRNGIVGDLNPVGSIAAFEARFVPPAPPPPPAVMPPPTPAAESPAPAGPAPVGDPPAGSLPPLPPEPVALHKIDPEIIWVDGQAVTIVKIPAMQPYPHEQPCVGTSCQVPLALISPCR